MAIRIYPDFGSDISYGDHRGTLELDYLHVTSASEYDKLDLCIEGKGEQRESFISMTLTLTDAKILLRLLEEKIDELDSEIFKHRLQHKPHDHFY